LQKNTRGQFHQRFYKQLLRTWNTKAQKYSPANSVFFALLGSVHAKAARKALMKLTPAEFWLHPYFDL